MSGSIDNENRLGKVPTSLQERALLKINPITVVSGLSSLIFTKMGELGCLPSVSTEDRWRLDMYHALLSTIDFDTTGQEYATMIGTSLRRMAFVGFTQEELSVKGIVHASEALLLEADAIINQDDGTRHVMRPPQTAEEKFTKRVEKGVDRLERDSAHALTLEVIDHLMTHYDHLPSLEIFQEALTEIQK